MSALNRFTNACLFGLVLAATAVAAPEQKRVLVADPDPELVHAIETSLAPWKLVVVTEPAIGSVDPAMVHVRADAANAHFIVWREGTELVVFDRERGTTERRNARAGAFDPVSAAAAALTVKTMMRLPPPPDGTDGTGAGPSEPIGFVAPVEDPNRVEVRVQAGLAGRAASGSETALGARGAFAAMVRPLSSIGFRIGLAADLGTGSTVDEASFQGTWSDWAVRAIGSWTFPVDRFELEPSIAGGVTRTSLDGTEGGGMNEVTRAERALLTTASGGLTVRLPVGMWSVGASVGVDLTFGAPTYMRTNNGMGMGSSTLFEVPSFAMVMGIVMAADLGR